MQVPFTVVPHQEHQAHTELELKVQSEFTEVQVDPPELVLMLRVKVQVTSKEVHLLPMTPLLRPPTKLTLLVQLESVLLVKQPHPSMLLALRDSALVLTLRSVPEPPLELLTELIETWSLSKR